MDSLLESISILKINKDERIEQADQVICEAPLTIFVNDQELVTLLCSPVHQKNWALGFLFSEGLIQSKDMLQNMLLNESKGVIWIRLYTELTIDDNFRKGRTVTSGCARGMTYHKAFDAWNGKYVHSKLTVSADVIRDIADKLKQLSPNFQQSGGSHSAALYCSTELLFSREDIGRHNAVDKIIGECLLQDIAAEDKILMTSGRVSSEILLKAARFQLPILASRAAPTSAAVKLADTLGITLIGFARGKRMNVYTNSWRIL